MLRHGVVFSVYGYVNFFSKLSLACYTL